LGGKRSIEGRRGDLWLLPQRKDRNNYLIKVFTTNEKSLGGGGGGKLSHRGGMKEEGGKKDRLQSKIWVFFTKRRPKCLLNNDREIVYTKKKKRGLCQGQKEGGDQPGGL